MNKNNCLNCDKSWMKDLLNDGKEIVCICSCDNAYIGYPDEAQNEQCRFKTVKCIKDYVECTKISKDMLGKMIATDFVKAFKKGCLYKVVSEKNGVYQIFNEQHKLSEFGKEIVNFFEFV